MLRRRWFGFLALAAQAQLIGLACRRELFVDPLLVERVPGYSLEDCAEIAGDQPQGTARRRGGTDVSRLTGRIVRLPIRLKDADLYALRFRP